MQKKLIALAVAGLASSGAFAQTNVTVYGILDAYVSYNSVDTKNAGTIQITDALTGLPGTAAKATTKDKDNSGYSIGSGGLSGSRLGFKGTEDLGGGLKANFQLEYAVQNDINSVLGSDLPGNMMRIGSVGLSGNWGSVNIGRLQSAAYDWDCTTAPLAGSGLDAKSKLAGHNLLSCGGGGRVNNAIAYNSPTFGGGFTAAVNLVRVTENQNGVGSAAPAAGSTLDNDAYAYILAGGYNNGPIAVNVIYTYQDNGVKNSGAVGGLFFVKKVDEWGISGSYDFGMVKVYGAWQNADWTVKSINLSRGSNNDKWTLGASMPLQGGKGLVSLQYADASIDRCTGTIAAATSATLNQANHGCDADAWTLAYTYAMSKRTTLYGGYISVNNSKAAQNTANSQFKTDVGGDASSWIGGIRHSF